MDRPKKLNSESPWMLGSIRIATPSMLNQTMMIKRLELKKTLMQASG